MGTVTVHIAGRSYDLACDDGQENRLAALASQVDREAQDLSRQLGALGEARLLAMAALMLADRLDEATAAPGPDPAALQAAMAQADAALAAMTAERDAALATGRRLQEDCDAAQAAARRLQAERDAALSACAAAEAARDAALSGSARQSSLFDDAALARLDDTAARIERALDNNDGAADR